MRLRNRHIYIIIFLLLICLSGFSSDNSNRIISNPMDQTPNIIFILTDDQRWDALGYSGNSIIQTPEMDKLAEAGTYFQNAIVTTPICAASRASIFSGVHERTHKYTFQTGAILDEYMVESYPVLMREAGYHTGFYGKFGVNYPGMDQLFDVLESYDRNNNFQDRRGYYFKKLGDDTVHLTRYTGQMAIDFIDEAPNDKPFCLSLSFSAPHAHDPAPKQYFWQEEPDKLYQDMEMPGPELADEKYFNQLPGPVQDGFNRLRWTWRYDTPDKYQHSVKGYYRMIKGIDLEIANIRKKLKEDGLDKNTVIILMGDNGYFLGERQLAGKWLMYDNSIRVPLIVFDPRIEKHQDIIEMALNIDVPATILDLAGIEKPESWQGVSLIPIISGKEKSLERDTVLIEHLWEFDNIPPSEGVRTAEWKYLRYINNKSFEELYHLTSDPKETNNLITNPRYEKVVKKLRKKNDQLAQKFADPYSGIPTGLTVEFIRNPRLTKIIDLQPEFSWIVPKQAVMQKAYQILLSSKEELANNNIGDVWDSGQVRSNKSTDIEMEDVRLNPNTKYYWKVRIFDQNNRLSEYSTVQEFQTGSIEESITSQNYFQIDRVSPTVFIKKTNGSYFADFGKDVFGTLEINYKSQKTKNITVRLGEKLKDENIDRKPGGTIRYQAVKLQLSPQNSSYLIELKADKRNTQSMAVALPDSFPVVMPFRYVEIEGIEELSQENITQLAFFSYFDDTTSSFSCSDDILNQVWELCKYSIKATTFAGLYIDGDRERIPYEADAYLNQLSHYSVDKEYAIARKTIEYFMKYPTWPTEWQLHVAMMFYQDYMYTGNTELIKKYYETLKDKTLMALEYEDGLISTSSPAHNGDLMLKLGFADSTKRLRDIVDWPQKGGFGGVMGETDGFEFQPVNTVINSFYYQNMKIIAEFASILGKTEEALEFRLKAATVKKAFNEKLFYKEGGYYRDGIGTDHGSVHANMLPLAFDLVPESYISNVTAYIKTRGMACSVYGSQYLLESLYKAGASNYALELMTSKHDRSWYNMIKMGSTITVEAWDMKYKPNSDWNHAWGAAPANIIPRGLWGIEPKTPGFGMVSIKPQMGKLENSSITLPTIKGQIKGKYKKIDSRFTKYSIELPANMVGEFNMDFSQQVVVTLDGKVVNLSFGSIRLHPGINDIEIRVNSF